MASDLCVKTTLGILCVGTAVAALTSCGTTSISCLGLTGYLNLREISIINTLLAFPGLNPPQLLMGSLGLTHIVGMRVMAGVSCVFGIAGIVFYSCSAGIAGNHLYSKCHDNG